MPNETNLDRAERFWSRVVLHKAHQCWRWNGAKNGKGYGQFSVSNHKTVAAHRFAYILENGPIPDGLLVRHRCDNPSCVNPRHLIAGTKSDNLRDAWERDRMPYGEWRSNAKLTNWQAAQIHKRLQSETARKLAEEYGVSKSVIDSIRRGKSWRRIVQEATP